ncbi:MAG: TolC family protein [SAR324 cluster bacterium]|nr:TolC family protein [SAR324 cluster bacterium]
MWFKNRVLFMALIPGILVISICGVSLAEEEIELHELVQIATEKDPSVLRLDLESKALRQKSVADGQLMDPRIKLGVSAIPLDSFDLEQEAMTQQQIGFQQVFPRGSSLGLKRKKGEAFSREKSWMAQWEYLKIQRDVRLAFLEIVHLRKSSGIVRKNKKLFQQLLEISRSRYASGKEKQQNVLEFELAVSRLDERLVKIQEQEDSARARLSKWVPREMAFRKFGKDFPEFPKLLSREKMVQRLFLHPAVKAADSHIQSQDLGLQLAQEKYKPSWMLDATYGHREGRNPNGSDRTDVLSAMVVFDLPIFTENRQDRIQESERLKTQAAKFKRDDRLRQHKSELEVLLAKHSRLEERLKVFSTQLIPESRNYRKTTLSGYQNRVTDLTDAIRAYSVELQTQLNELNVRFQRLVVQARILYLVGDK